MNSLSQRICLHSLAPFLVLLGVGLFGLTGWFPPTDPGLDAASIAALYEKDRTSIRFGLVLLALAGTLWWPFSAAISMQLKRIEGGVGPFTLVQMATATGTAVMISLSAFMFLLAAFRPEISPEIIRALNDFGWLLILGWFPPGFLQALAIGLCILGDRSTKGPYPRWVGFASVWVAVLLLPSALIPFFHGGPFAWNGIISFYFVATVFFIWILAMWCMTAKAIQREPQA